MVEGTHQIIKKGRTSVVAGKCHRVSDPGHLPPFLLPPLAPYTPHHMPTSPGVSTGQSSSGDNTGGYGLGKTLEISRFIYSITCLLLI